MRPYPSVSQILDHLMALGSSLSHQAIILGRRKACNQRGDFPRVQAQFDFGEKNKKRSKIGFTFKKTERYKSFAGKHKSFFRLLYGVFLFRGGGGGRGV